MYKFSIITASYNYENFIKETIESVINQTYANWEMIIVDDGSTDNSIEIIKMYCNKDDRIKLYTHENNQNNGLGETLKLGISKSNGDYIIFLESDDYIKNDYLQKKLDFVKKNTSVKFICNKIKPTGDFNAIKNSQGYLNQVNKYWEEHSKPHNVSNELHFWDMIPTFSCVMIKKELLLDCSFDSPKLAWLDWWLWAQISSKTDFYCLQEELTFWRLHSKSYIKRDNKSTKFLSEAYNYWECLYKILPPVTGVKTKLRFIIKRFLRYVKYKLILRV